MAASNRALCENRALGTISDSLLQALRKRQIGVLRIAFIGERNREAESRALLGTGNLAFSTHGRRAAGAFQGRVYEE